ncbi:MAG: hypothetical protein L0154_10495 [Chloroflexi bacterium]|nr:hypothetical protein [Chloroflexota bacterium]
MPQFWIDNGWLDITEIVAPLESLAQQSASGFTNTHETLFDAIGERPVDFEGRLAGCAFDLLSHMVAGPEIFPSRDEALTKMGSFQDTWRSKGFELIFGNGTSYVKTP